MPEELTAAKNLYHRLEPQVTESPSLKPKVNRRVIPQKKKNMINNQMQKKQRALLSISQEMRRNKNRREKIEDDVKSLKSTIVSIS